jgi:hypothetical protein
MDNLNIRRRKTLADHSGQGWGAISGSGSSFMPKHGNWLNQVEIEMSLFARQCLVTPDFKPGPLTLCR